MRQAIAILLLLVSAAAAAQGLYKWTDADGHVVYSDRPPPKGFKGEVTRIEPDTPAAPLGPAPVPAMPAKPAAEAGKAAPADIAAQRRSTRQMLGARLDAAREKLEAARKALAGSDPTETDRRVIHRRTEGKGSPSLATRGNCRTTKTSAGKEFTTCPTSILSDEYNERREKLQAAVDEAEAEVAEAEVAYRRGVD